MQIVRNTTMNGLLVPEQTTHFSMTLNVSDLERSINFYRVLFGIAPTIRQRDLAQFELNEPSCAVTLVSGGPPAGGPMSHAGLRLTSEEAVLAAQRRLQAANIPTRVQVDTHGCYAVQTKIWLTDPDQTIWEVYTVKEDIPFGDVSGGSVLAPQVRMSAAAGESVEVMYKGPFAELVDDHGRVYRRGQRVAVTAAVWEDLWQGACAAQFAFFERAPACSSRCGS